MPDDQGSRWMVAVGEGMTKRWTGFWAICIASFGCATIGQGKPVETEEPIKTLREVVPIGGATGNVEQDGTRITVTATHVCGQQERAVVLRTNRIEDYNASAGTTWALAGGGILLGGAGVWAIADATKVNPNDESGQNYNPVGPGNARAIGIGTAVLGGALLTVAAVDAIRASGATEEHQQVTRAPVMMKQNVPCKDPVTKAPVVVRLEAGEFRLGDTDDKGRLSVDLDTALDPSFVPQRNEPLRVLVAGASVGDADPAPLYKAREMRAWRAIDFAKCRNATTTSDCDALIAFLKTWPGGPHGSSTRKALADMGSRLVELGESEMWGKTDTAACSKGSGSDSASDVSSACDAIERFLAKYPYGAHSTAANDALKAGKARQKAIEARAEKERKAAEAKEKAAQAAMERQLEAERLRERQYRAREQARAMSECRSNCSDRCVIGRMTGDRLQPCIRICVRNQCSGVGQ